MSYVQIGVEHYSEGALLAYYNTPQKLDQKIVVNKIE